MPQVSEDSKDVFGELRAIRQRLAPDAECTRVIDMLLEGRDGNGPESDGASEAEDSGQESDGPVCFTVPGPYVPPSDDAPVPRRSGLRRWPGGGQGAVIAGISVVTVASMLILGSVGSRPTDASASPSKNRTMTAAAASSPTVRAMAHLDWSTRGLPDPRLTPGCQDLTRWSASPIPAEVNRRMLSAYGIGPKDTQWVVCQVVPAPLHGTNDPSNLFPLTPWFAELKTHFDQQLENLVWAHKITFADAARELTHDWIEAAQRRYPHPTVSTASTVRSANGSQVAGGAAHTSPNPPPAAKQRWRHRYTRHRWGRRRYWRRR